MDGWNERRMDEAADETRSEGGKGGRKGGRKNGRIAGMPSESEKDIGKRNEIQKQSRIIEFIDCIHSHFRSTIWSGRERGSV